jgi:hypothetical protein
MIAVAHEGAWKPEGACVDIDDPELDDIIAADAARAK